MKFGYDSMDENTEVFDDPAGNAERGMFTLTTPVAIQFPVTKIKFFARKRHCGTPRILSC